MFDLAAHELKNDLQGFHRITLILSRGRHVSSVNWFDKCVGPESGRACPRLESFFAGRNEITRGDQFMFFQLAQVVQEDDRRHDLSFVHAMFRFVQHIV